MQSNYGQTKKEQRHYCLLHSDKLIESILNTSNKYFEDSPED